MMTRHPSLRRHEGVWRVETGSSRTVSVDIGSEDEIRVNVSYAWSGCLNYEASNVYYLENGAVCSSLRDLRRDCSLQRPYFWMGRQIAAPRTASQLALLGPVATTMDRESMLYHGVQRHWSAALSQWDEGDLCDRDIAAFIEGVDNSISGLVEYGHSLNTHKAIEEPQERIKSGVINFSKTWLYANSRLPPHLAPAKIYTETWPILCRAAQAAEAVYHQGRMAGGEREDFIGADWRHGTKAMVLKSIPMDDRNLIILAIRGSKWNLADWATNFRPAPTLPTGFLDDEGNACHAGFLRVARAMLRPVAARLRELLEQDPSRTCSSLVLTGHSAGGAVASLLYMHMLSDTVESELNVLTGCFKRIHCITFGAPPVSLIPLRKPRTQRFASSLFVSFVNEGDPVVRADKEYLRTLARILAAPAPNVYPLAQTANKKKGRIGLRGETKECHQTPSQRPYCWIPEANLSNAGRLVLLRTRSFQQTGVEAVAVDDSKLRQVLFGDPAMHAMTLYKARIDELAIAAVTGRGVV